MQNLFKGVIISSLLLIGLVVFFYQIGLRELQELGALAFLIPAFPIIGSNFAFTEAMMVLASVLRVYEPLVTPGHKVEKEPLVTLRPKYGMRMDLR